MRARVLIVDDDAMVRAALAVVLGEAHEVVTATSVGAALKVLRTTPAESAFHAVLCDLQLGDGDASQIHAALMSAHTGMAPAFAVMTGGACSDELGAFVARCPHVLRKPFDLDEAAALIALLVSA